MINRQLRAAGKNLEQIAQNQRLGFVSWLFVGRPCLSGCRRSCGGLRSSPGRANSELKMTRPLRLPKMRFCTIVAAKADPTIVGQLRAAMFGRPGCSHRRLDLGKTPTA